MFVKFKARDQKIVDEMLKSYDGRYHHVFAYGSSFLFLNLLEYREISSTLGTGIAYKIERDA